MSRLDEVNEARHPQSDADFLSKANIALKEARETEYWLNLLHDRSADITIRVHNRDLQSYGAMLKLFQGMNDHINYLQRKGIVEVNLIELPYVKAECEDEVLYNCEPFDTVDVYVWKVYYLNGCSELYYNPFSREIVES